MTTEIVLGVGGGIAAYKVCEVLRRIRDLDAAVTVVPTESALRFVGEPTWTALSGRPAACGLFDDVHEVPHVRLGQSADLVVVAPATANLLAKAAHGLADDLLTNTLLTARCPVIMFPAMHTEMWEHPATVANVATLRSRGVLVIDPDSGRLTGSDSGPGRLPEPASIVATVRALFDSPGQDLAGRRVIVTAGGTREPLDPVRFLGNRSSGRQGMALAAAAVARGAHVTVLHGHVSVPVPAGVHTLTAETAADMLTHLRGLAASADVIIMAAAIADFRAQHLPETKIKKSDMGVSELQLTHNPDVLRTLVDERTGRLPLLVGFAAETGDDETSWLDFARRKIRAKGCDLLVANPVGHQRGFESETNEAVILSADRDDVVVDRVAKVTLAHRILDEIRIRTAHVDD